MRTLSILMLCATLQLSSCDGIPALRSPYVRQAQVPITERELGLYALTVASEAGGYAWRETTQADMEGVANVILNRYLLANADPSVRAQYTRGRTPSFANILTAPEQFWRGRPSHQRRQQALETVLAVLEGGSDNTGGATHFKNNKLTRVRWDGRPFNSRYRLSYSTRIGDHWYYQLLDAHGRNPVERLR